MRRMLSIILAFVVAVFPVASSFGQASRYRIPTGADTEQGTAPSFRGSERSVMTMPQQGQGAQIQGGRIPIPFPSSAGGGVAGTTAGEAAMMAMGYQVHILGEVINPGTYRVSASDRLSEVLNRAGGLAENGSERNIELRRKGHVSHVDLLSYKLHGQLADNPYLIDNDVVFVPLRNKVVQVVGAAKRPEMYELTSERTLDDLIQLAGGFNAATAMDEPIRVIRFSGGEKRVEEVPIVQSDLDAFAVQNGDVVVVPNLVTKNTDFDYNVASIPGDQVFYPSYEDRVFVLGGVAFPGAYPFSPYYMVNQYISLAGGLNDRGKDNYKIISIDGKIRKARTNDRVNPGDTIAVKQMWMSPAAWAGFFLSIASFGLSASSTIIALRR